MREILFRGRDIAGNWHYGTPLVFTDGFVCITSPHIHNKSVVPETVGQFTGRYDDTKWEELTDEERKAFYQAVKSEDGITVKYDRVERVKKLWRGRRIFEGDVVDGLMLHSMPIRAAVVFQDGSFGLDWRRGDVSVFTPFTSICNTVFKVIGNIHDNPELLEGK